MIIQIKEEYKQILNPETVFKLLSEVLNTEDQIDQEKEHFWVIYLNNRLQIQSLELISLGTLTTSLVHPREVFRRAIMIGCAQIIIAHNHPSGDPTPSEDDILITQRLKKAGELIGIEVIDHVIIAKDGFFNFASKKML